MPTEYCPWQTQMRKKYRHTVPVRRIWNGTFVLLGGQYKVYEPKIRKKPIYKAFRYDNNFIAEGYDFRNICYNYVWIFIQREVIK